MKTTIRQKVVKLNYIDFIHQFSLKSYSPNLLFEFNYLQEKKVIEPEPSLKKRKNKVEPATNKKLKTEAYLAKKK